MHLKSEIKDEVIIHLVMVYHGILRVESQKRKGEFYHSFSHEHLRHTVPLQH